MCESKSAVWLLGELSTAPGWYLLMIDHWWRGIGDWCFFGDWYNSWLAVGKRMWRLWPRSSRWWDGDDAPTLTWFDTAQVAVPRPTGWSVPPKTVYQVELLWTNLQDASFGRHGSVLQCRTFTRKLWRDLDIVQFNVREQTEASGSLWHQSKVL